MTNNRTVAPRAYAQHELPDVVPLSKEQIRKHIERGDLQRHYSGTKPLFHVDEVDAFVKALPHLPEAL